MAPVLAYIKRFAFDKFSHPITSRQGPPQIANDRDERKLTENDSHSNLTSFSLSEALFCRDAMYGVLFAGRLYSVTESTTRPVRFASARRAAKYYPSGAAPRS